MLGMLKFFNPNSRWFQLVSGIIGIYLSYLVTGLIH